MQDLPTEPAHSNPLEPRDLAPGTVIGRYVLLEPLGRGGMGVVYAAHDPELDRRVAIKVIAAADGGSASTPLQARARLLREAQAMAKLAHPNVITVHDVGTFGDQVFVAMELVEGTTLRQWLKESSKSIGAIADVFRHAGEGLTAAHEAGIIHRDFKPDNVLVGRDGRVRVLDFGLARAAVRVPGEPARARPIPLPRVSASTAQETTLEAPPSHGGRPAHVALADTLEAPPSHGKPPSALATDETVEAPAVAVTPAAFTGSLTQTGTFLGTPLYMAPEQYLGGQADARSDQYAFCVALYEAIYDDVPFGAKTMTELVARATEGKIPNPPRDPRVPKRLRSVVVRGLSPRPEDRFPSMRSLVEALVQSMETPQRRVWPMAVLALAGATLVGGAFSFRGSAKPPAVTPPAPVSRAAPPSAPPQIRQERLTFAGDITLPVLSPDGRKIAYGSGGALVVRDLANGAERRLCECEASDIAWYSDGRAIGYRSDKTTRSMKVSVEDGSSSDVEYADFRDCTPDRAACSDWNESGDSIAINRRDGSSVKLAISAPHRWVETAAISPDARRIAVNLATDETHSMWILDIEGNGQRKLVDSTQKLSSPRWSPGGDALYWQRCDLQTCDLVTTRIDPRTGESDGAVVPLLSGIEMGVHEGISISFDGRRLAYVREHGYANAYLLRARKEGAPELRRLTSGASVKSGLSVSPDGQSIAYVSTDATSRLVTQPIAGGAPTTLAVLEEPSATAWSPDGREIAFVGKERGDTSRRVRAVPVSGGASRSLGGSDPDPSVTLAWIPNAGILYSPPSHTHFQLLDPSTGADRSLGVAPKGWAFYPVVSPDASELAFFWNRPDGRGIWTIRIANGASRLVVGTRAMLVGFSADGKTIYGYNTLDTAKDHHIFAVNREGGELREFMVSPGDGGITEAKAVPGTSGDFVVISTEREADAWLVEGFAPDFSPDGG